MFCYLTTLVNCVGYRALNGKMLVWMMNLKYLERNNHGIGYFKIKLLGFRCRKWIKLMFFIIGSFEPRNPRIPSKKVKCSRYRPDVVQRVGRGTALLFHDGGTRRGWVVSGTPRPHFTPGESPRIHFTGGWVGPRAGLDRRKISSPPGFDPGPSSS